MKFSATIDRNGKTACGIRVPEEVVAGLGSSRRPAVRVTLAGHTYRSTIAARGGEFLLPVSADNREAAGVAAGDEVLVRVALDTEPRVVTVPRDFDKALDARPEAKRFFSTLGYSEQRWFVLGIEGAKKPETRERRIAKAVERLASGRGQR
ncbi:MAG TPA: YdeI/OmpD-associated family protein [Thermoleophilaceae bacterium]|jgi:hypothetical protein